MRYAHAVLDYPLMSISSYSPLVVLSAAIVSNRAPSPRFSIETHLPSISRRAGVKAAIIEDKRLVHGGSGAVRGHTVSLGHSGWGV